MTTSLRVLETRVAHPLAPIEQLPADALMVSAYHRAHAQELHGIIADLPLHPNQHVLDMACGDGTYARMLAERVGPYGTVTAVDRSPAYLHLAQQHAAESPQRNQIRFQQGDIARLPFDYALFDLVWCAQNLYTLPDPQLALRELIRVTRPGGTVAIFEHDLLHHLVLPWPAELELELRQAQFKSLQRESSSAGAFYGGRDLTRLFIESGLQDCVVTPYSSSRTAPLSADERLFLSAYLEGLRERARPYLPLASYQHMQTLLNPSSPDALLNQPTLTVTYINFLACGRKPASR